jgi:hypothetical protein
MTRWSSHASALQTIFNTFDAIIDTLHSLESDDASHRVCNVKANGLMEYLLSEHFVLTGMLFIKIFDMTSPLSKFLQKKNIDLLAAVTYVQNILTRIKNLRTDIKFGNLIDQKNKFIQSQQNDYSFTPIVSTRIKRIKKWLANQHQMKILLTLLIILE